MDEHRWAARQQRPDGLITPVRLDPEGLHGPTRNQARGPRWRRTSSGRYVPAIVDASNVHQRIFEQAARIRDWGAVTAWAGLRWRGARFFEGTTFPAGEQLPVPLVIGSAFLRPDPQVSISFERLAPHERELVGGIWVTVAERALFDEVRRHGELRRAVVDIEMAIAAGLLTVGQFTDYVATRQVWTGVGLARDAVAAAGLGCRTPQEVRMVLTWMWDAGLDRPLCNVPIFDLEGRLIAIADLLDVVAECVGEYQGADHKDGEHHRRDVAREQRLRDAGLECFEVVAATSPIVTWWSNACTPRDSAPPSGRRPNDVGRSSSRSGGLRGQRSADCDCTSGYSLSDGSCRPVADEPFDRDYRGGSRGPVENGAMRAIFFEEDDANAAVARLRAGGFEATATRERLAGEDDDEDHPWAVVSDAPAFMLELVVDEHDGWLDEGEEPPRPLPPLDLPAGPRRIKRPD